MTFIKEKYENIFKKLVLSNDEIRDILQLYVSEELFKKNNISLDIKCQKNQNEMIFKYSFSTHDPYYTCETVYSIFDYNDVGNNIILEIDAETILNVQSFKEFEKVIIKLISDINYGDIPNITDYGMTDDCQAMSYRDMKNISLSNKIKQAEFYSDILKIISSKEKYICCDTVVHSDTNQYHEVSLDVFGYRTSVLLNQKQYTISKLKGFFDE